MGSRPKTVLELSKHVWTLLGLGVGLWSCDCHVDDVQLTWRRTVMGFDSVCSCLENFDAHCIVSTLCCVCNFPGIANFSQSCMDSV